VLEISHIYLIKSDGDEYPKYKIGYTKNEPTKRLKQHATGNPDELSIINVFESQHERKVETILHRRYQIYHRRGEWFDLPIEEVNNFMKSCEMIEQNLNVLKDNIFV